MHLNFATCSYNEKANLETAKARYSVIQLWPRRRKVEKPDELTDRLALSYLSNMNKLLKE